MKKILQCLGHFSFEKCQAKGDMTDAYKIMNGMQKVFLKLIQI